MCEIWYIYRLRANPHMTYKLFLVSNHKYGVDVKRKSYMRHTNVQTNCSQVQCKFVPMRNMRAKTGVEVELHTFIISEVDGSMWSD